MSFFISLVLLNANHAKRAILIVIILGVRNKFALHNITHIFDSIYRQYKRKICLLKHDVQKKETSHFVLSLIIDKLAYSDQEFILLVTAYKGVKR